MAGDKTLSRKERRKEQRQYKKWKKNAFHRSQKVLTLEGYRKQKVQTGVAVTAEEKKRRDKARKKLQKKKRAARRKQEKLEKEEEVKQKIEEEEKEIKKLEKLLRMKKGIQPKSFRVDQLDYLLNFQEDAELFRKAYEKGSTLPPNFADKDGASYQGESQEDNSGDDFSNEDEDGDEFNSFDEDDSDEDDASGDFFQHSDEESEEEEEEAGDDASDIQIFSRPDPKTGKSILKRSASSDSSAAPSSKRLKWEDSVEKPNSDDDDEEEEEEEETEEEEERQELEEDNSDNDFDEEMHGEESDEEMEEEEVEEEEEEEGEEDEDEEEEEEETEEGEEDDEEETLQGAKSEDIEEATPALKEDIYGRLRDAEGNVVKAESGKYIPPAKRALMALSEDKGRAARLEVLRKGMKGLINRVNDSNIQSIANDIEEKYRNSSRSDVNETLYGLVYDAVIAKSLTPEHIVNVLALLVAILHGNVGSEVGAFFIQRLASKWSQLVKTAGSESGKEIDNVILLISALYNFKVIGHEVIFDLMNKAVEAFGERDIEMLVLILRSCGFGLRKETPLQLKAVIAGVQGKAGQADTSGFQDPSRVQWLLDTLLAIRNNNVRKMPNYNPQGMERMKKLGRNYIRGKSLGDDVVRVSLEDLLNADLSGKWWVVGSAWQGRTPAQGPTQPDSSQTKEPVYKFKEEVLKLARKQKMTSEPRKTIFCIIMSSENVYHALQNLKQLGLSKSQEADTLAVGLDLAQQSKQYNHFYSLLLQLLAQDDRELKFKMKLMWWDKLAEIGRLVEVSQRNLAKTLAHLLLHSIVTLSVFKKLQFGMLDKPTEDFVCSVLKSVLTTESQRTVHDIFQVASRDMSQGLLFLMEKRFSKSVKEDSLLYSRVQYVCTMLGAAS